MIRYVFSLVLLSALLSWGYADEISPQSADFISDETVSDSHPGEMVTSEVVAVSEQTQLSLEIQKESLVSQYCIQSSTREVPFIMCKKVGTLNGEYELILISAEENCSWSWYGPVHQFFMA